MTLHTPGVAAVAALVLHDASFSPVEIVEAAWRLEAKNPSCKHGTSIGKA